MSKNLQVGFKSIPCCNWGHYFVEFAVSTLAYEDSSDFCRGQTSELNEGMMGIATPCNIVFYILFWLKWERRVILDTCSWPAPTMVVFTPLAREAMRGSHKHLIYPFQSYLASPRKEKGWGSSLQLRARLRDSDENCWPPTFPADEEINISALNGVWGSTPQHPLHWL